MVKTWLFDFSIVNEVIVHVLPYQPLFALQLTRCLPKCPHWTLKPNWTKSVSYIVNHFGVTLSIFPCSMWRPVDIMGNISSLWFLQVNALSSRYIRFLLTAQCCQKTKITSFRTMVVLHKATWMLEYIRISSTSVGLVFDSWCRFCLSIFAGTVCIFKRSTQHVGLFVWC